MAMQNCSVKWDVESCYVESDESCSSEDSAATHLHYTPDYEAGDLVWGKVKSHPWWPGQIFNVVDASEEARCSEKPGKLLVAFYGDHTFAWLDPSQVLEFKPHFAEKAKATDAQLFKDALSEALDEVCRRAQLGLECRCCRSEWDNDADKGVQEGTLLRLYKGVSRSKETLDARRTLRFLKDLALSPCNPASISSVYASVLCGHILGIRIGTANKGKYGTLQDWRLAASTCKDDTREEAVFSSTDRADIGTSGAKSQIEQRKCGNAGNNKRVFPLEDREKTSKRPRVGEFEVDSEEKARRSNLRAASGQRLRFKRGIYGRSGSVDKASNRQRSTSPDLRGDSLCFFKGEQSRGWTTSLGEPSACQDDKATHSLMQVFWELHDAAIDPLFYHGASYNTTVTKMEAIFKFRDLVFKKSAGYAYHWENHDREETKMRRKSLSVDICAGGTDSSIPVTKVAQYCRPSAQKQRTVRLYMNGSENLELLDSRKAQPHSPRVAPSTKACHEGAKLSCDRDGIVSGTSFEGVSQAHSRARETVLSGKLDVHDLLIEAHRKTSGITKEVTAKLGKQGQSLMKAQKRMPGFTKGALSNLDVHELLVEAQKKKLVCEEEATAMKVFEKAPKTSAMGRDSNGKSLEDALKVSGFKGKIFPDANSDSEILTDHFVRASMSDEGIPMEHFSEATPDIEIPGKQNSTRKPHFGRGMCANDRNLEASQSPSQSHGNAVSLTKGQHDDEACARVPASLLMTFPQSVSLPLEMELNVMFAAFGALETRVHRDTASAQVIFKQRDEAEAAFKCVKVVSPFGKAPVAFSLQHHTRP